MKKKGKFDCIEKVKKSKECGGEIFQNQAQNLDKSAIPIDIFDEIMRQLLRYMDYFESLSVKFSFLYENHLRLFFTCICGSRWMASCGIIYRAK